MFTQPSQWIHRAARRPRAKAQGAAGALIHATARHHQHTLRFHIISPLPHGAHWAVCYIKCVFNPERGAA